MQWLSGTTMNSWRLRLKENDDEKHYSHAGDLILLATWILTKVTSRHTSPRFWRMANTCRKFYHCRR